MKELYEMKLHELIPVTGTNYIECLRVAGGWVYTTYAVIGNDARYAGFTPTSVFVPYNNEFDTR